MEKFLKIDKTKLTSGQHFAFMQAFSDVLGRINPSAKKFQSALTALNSALEAEDKSMKQARGSSLTKQIQEQDGLRDRTYSGLKKIVTAWSEMGLETEAAAAEGLMKLIKLYNIDPKAQMDEETGLLDNFIGDVQASASLSAAVDSLGVRHAFEEMVSANAAVKRLLSERHQEGAEKVVGALKSARVEVDACYDKMVGLVESFAETADDTEPFERIIGEWNVAIGRYRTMLVRKSTKDTPEEEGL